MGMRAIFMRRSCAHKLPINRPVAARTSDRLDGTWLSNRRHGLGGFVTRHRADAFVIDEDLQRVELDLVVLTRAGRRVTMPATGADTPLYRLTHMVP